MIEALRPAILSQRMTRAARETARGPRMAQATRPEAVCRCPMPSQRACGCVIMTVMTVVSGL